MTWFKWSRTASSNSTADSTINWAEGQPPSSVNDSARAMMAAAAKYRDDISGAIVTSGTSTAYTVTSYQSFTSLSAMDGAMIAFTPHTTNGATVTLNVDGLGAKALRWATGVELQSNTLISGTPYVATYSNGNSEWVLQGVTSSPYGIPLGCGMDYWGTTAPSSAYAFPMGQAISRTTYATLFSIFGTTYGVGDGSLTFNLPDRSGRISAQKEASASRLTTSYFGGDSTALGATGGSESHTLTTAQLASHTHANTLNNGNHSHTVDNGSVSVTSGSGNAVKNFDSGNATTSSTVNITITNASAGSGNAHNNVQPTIVCNYIIRII